MPNPLLRAGKREGEPDRLIGFSDGVFAVAITLVALQFALPRDLDVDTFIREFDEELWKVPAYALTFLIVGLFWQIHHRMFDLIPRQNSTLVVLNLTTLGAVCLVPFASSTFGEYVNSADPIARRVTMFYAIAMATVGLLLGACWWYASWNRRLIDDRVGPAMVTYIRARGMVTPVVFLLSLPVVWWNPTVGAWSWMVLFPVFGVVNKAFGPAAEAEGEANADRGAPPSS